MSESLRYTDNGWAVLDIRGGGESYSISTKVGSPHWYIRSIDEDGYHPAMFTFDPFVLVPERLWPAVFDFAMEVYRG